MLQDVLLAKNIDYFKIRNLLIIEINEYNIVKYLLCSAVLG